MKHFWTSHKLFRRLSSSLVIALHLLAASHIQEAFAGTLASSSSYKLCSSSTDESSAGSINSAFYTKLLLHADGSEGSKSFKDEKGKTVTVFGDTRIDTTQSKFSGSSALFDGNGDYLALDDSNDWNFGAEDFTIDFWVRFNDVPANLGINEFYSQLADNQHFVRFYLQGPSYLTFYVTEDNKILTLFHCVKEFSAHTWYHIALARDGNNWYIFINGVSQPLSLSIGSYGITMPDIAADLDIGIKTYGSSEYIEYLNAYIDEYRISKGIARWTSDFTPASAPYDLSTETSRDQSYSSLSFEVKQDSIGESCIGNLDSASYSASSGFITTFTSAPPVFTGTIPNCYWKENSPYPGAFDLDDYFASPEGLPLTYTVTGNSNIDVTIDPQTNIVSFTQPQAWYGIEKVVFTAKDSQGNLTSSNEATLQVEGVDNPPVLEYIPDIIAVEGDLIQIIPKASDLDGDEITYSFTSPLDEQSGKWQTNYDSKGEYPVTVTASDPGGLKDFQEVKISVKNKNWPPVFLGDIGPIIVNEGDRVTINPEVKDPDDDQISFSYSGNKFNSEGVWLTDYDDAGTYSIIVTASDGYDLAQQTVEVTVNNVNQPPQAELTLSSYTTNAGSNINIILNASDPDNNQMSFSIKKDNQEIASGDYTDTYSISTSFSGIGNHTITATVTDKDSSNPLSVTVSKTVDVAEANPDINPIMGDFNADGLTDLGYHSPKDGSWHICLSQKGKFEAATTWLSSFGDSKEYWPIGGDFNADGKSDIGIYKSKTGELKTAYSTSAGFSTGGVSLTVDFASSSWQPFTGNFNSDKYTDLAFYNKDTGEVKISLGSISGFSSFTTWHSDFGKDYVALGGDFNADGLTDLCLFKKSSGEFKVAFSNTEAFVDGSTWISGFASDKDPLVSDFNNDGLADIGYWDKDSSNWYYTLSNGSKFIDKGAWLEGFGSSSDASASTADFNGDGITDPAVFNRNSQGINCWNIKLTNKKPTDLLIETDNGIGGKTQIEYTYASSYDNPGLPFPVYVAKAISSIDTLPADQPIETYSQTFTYSGGYYDTNEREFRGFETVTVTDPITKNYTQTQFHQAKPNEDGALKGQIKQIVSYDGNKKLISQTINTYTVQREGSQDKFLGFPALTKVETTACEETGASVSTINTLKYDNTGNPIEVVNEGTPDIGDEKKVHTSYSAPYAEGLNRPKEVILKDSDDNKVSHKTFTYDTRGNTKTESVWLYDPLTEKEEFLTTSYEYDDLGNLIKTTNPKGISVTTEYETVFHAFPSKVTNTLGHTITYKYDERFGKATEITDANNAVSKTTLDSFGRVTEEINAYNEVVTKYEYPDFNTKRTIQDNEGGGTKEEGRLETTQYIDGLGRVYKTESSGEDENNPAKIISEVFYNNRGFKDYEILPRYEGTPQDKAGCIRYEYDLRGRIVKTITDYEGAVKDTQSSISYLTPLYTETYNSLNQKKGVLKDIYGNVIAVKEFMPGDAYTKSDPIEPNGYGSSGGYVTHYEYDSQNNLIKTTDNQGNIIEITYDSLGRKLKMNDPDMGEWLYDYDDLGNLLRQTDNQGNVLVFKYDSINRLTKKKSYSHTRTVEGEVSYYYDDTSKQNCQGRLSKVTYPEGLTEFFYDKLGREVKSIKTINQTSYTVERAYDKLGRLASLTYPDGQTVNYSYDTNSGLLEKVTKDEGGGTKDEYVKDITYNAQGQIKTVKYGNNTQTDYTYANDLRLEKILTQNQGLTTLQELYYDFDKAGNLTELTDNLRSYNKKMTYTYDSLNRLTKAENIAKPNSSSYQDLTYQYDSIGNMTYKSDIGVMSYGLNAGPHAVTTAGAYSYTYDLNGNMIKGKNKEMSYSPENRLKKVIQAGTTTEFTYDGDGGRTRRTRDDGSGTKDEIIYVGSLFEIATAKDAKGETQSTQKKHIFAGSNKVCTIEPTHTYYVHSDHLGSSNVISDENGNQVSKTEYQPYGLTAQQTGTDVTNYKFTGKELDTTGLYYYGARYYDPEIGRFTQADPTIQHPYDPQDFNRYSYCRNNPINYIDPTGYGWFKNLFKSFAKGFASGAAGGLVTGLLFPFIGPAAFIVGGAVAGATGATLNGAGWQGILIGAGIGAVTAGALGGIGATNLTAAVIAGSALAIGGAVYAYQQGGWEGVANYSAGVVGGAAGFATGYGVGSSIGNSLKAPPLKQEPIKVSLKTDQKPQVSSDVKVRVEDVDGMRIIDYEMTFKSGDKTVYRQGTIFEKDPTYIKGREWSSENPLTTPNYAQKYGLPAENSGSPDWVVKGHVKGEYGIGPAPASYNKPANTGGAPEIRVNNPNEDVTLDWFHMP